jgi:hypothetical protein
MWWALGKSAWKKWNICCRPGVQGQDLNAKSVGRNQVGSDLSQIRIPDSYQLHALNSGRSGNLGENS